MQIQLCEGQFYRFESGKNKDSPKEINQLSRRWLKSRIRKCKEVRGKCNWWPSDSLPGGSRDLGGDKLKRKLLTNAQRGKKILDLEMATEFDNSVIYDKRSIY